jgi:hypothetical protein
VAFCGSHTLQSLSPTVHACATLKCRSWSCETCGPERTTQLIAQIIAGRPNKFATLTIQRDGTRTARQARALISKAWPKLRHLIDKRLGVKNTPFFAVIEKHKSGWPHLHLALVMEYVDQAWLSNQWKRLTGSPIVHITQVRSQRHLARYVAKYMSKDLAQFGTHKRYWCSQNWPGRRQYKAKQDLHITQGWTQSVGTQDEFTSTHIHMGWHPRLVKRNLCVFWRHDYNDWANAP